MKKIYEVLRRKIVAIPLVATLMIAGIGVAFFVKSQSKLREYRLNVEQNKAILEADDLIKQIEERLNIEKEKRHSLLGAFALSVGIKKEEFNRFREVKRDGVTHFIELTPEELKKIAEQSQPQQ